MDSDETLMKAYLEGDEGAFEQLFERYAPRLQALMERRIRREEVASELVQQTFLQFHRARADFDPDATVRPWLYTIALNLRRDYLRSAGTRREQTTDDLPERGTEDRALKSMADREVVHRAIEALTDKQRPVIELHWFEELTFAEIGEALDISRSAAKVRAHRGYKAMREYVDTETNVTESELVS